MVGNCLNGEQSRKVLEFLLVVWKTYSFYITFINAKMHSFGLRNEVFTTFSVQYLRVKYHEGMRSEVVKMERK